MEFRKTLRCACFLLATVAVATAAQAQLFRAYLSSSGNDANPCTLPAPCRLLPAALNAVATGGEIWMLDSANYNTGTVTVAKAVSILAIPGVVGSVAATASANGLVVSAPGGTVSLANLVFTSLGNGVNGLAFVAGGTLNVNQCEFRNMTSAGVSATAPGGILNIRDAVFRDSVGGLDISGSIRASIERVQVTGGTFGLIVQGNSRVNVANANFSGMSSAVVAFALGNSVTSIAIRDSIITAVGSAIYAQTTNPGDVAQVTATRVGISGASSAAMTVQQATGTTAQIAADGNTITDSNVAFRFLGTTIGTINSRSNNVLNGVTTNVTGGGSVTSLGGI